jgi:hypothetical protein
MGFGGAVAPNLISPATAAANANLQRPAPTPTPGDSVTSTTSTTPGPENTSAVGNAPNPFAGLSGLPGLNNLNPDALNQFMATMVSVCLSKLHESCLYKRVAY